MSFFYVSLGLAAFLIAFGIIFIRLARDLPEDAFKMGLALAAFGVFYFALAHYSVLVGFGLSLDEAYQAPCEYVLHNQTVNGATTVYDYADTCAGTTTPEPASNLFIIFVWLIYIDLFAMFAGASMLLFQWVKRGW